MFPSRQNAYIQRLERTVQYLQGSITSLSFTAVEGMGGKVVTSRELSGTESHGTKLWPLRTTHHVLLLMCYCSKGQNVGTGPSTGPQAARLTGNDSNWIDDAANLPSFLISTSKAKILEVVIPNPEGGSCWVQKELLVVEIREHKICICLCLPSVNCTYYCFLDVADRFRKQLDHGFDLCTRGNP